jgi:hypothetical protein
VEPAVAERLRGLGFVGEVAERRVRRAVDDLADLARRDLDPAISLAVSMKLIGTSTTPRRAVANETTANSQPLCESSASRSPRASSAAAVRLTAASSSA